MACFIVPGTEAIITTIAEKAIKKTKGESELTENISLLNKMLWGGSAMLAFEHVWHGEVTPWFPFLTATTNPADTAEMFYEMATSGTAMALLVTAVWGGIVLVRSRLKAKTPVKVESESIMGGR